MAEPLALTRREALQLASAALVAMPLPQRPAKRVIVAGAGIAGLSCAWNSCAAGTR